MRNFDKTKVSGVVNTSKIRKQKKVFKSKENLNSNIPFLLNVMSKSQRVIFLFLVAIWISSLVLFFEWWISAEHVIGRYKFALNSAMFIWTMILPGYFFFFVYRMKRVNPEIKIPKEWRVAMIVTRAPSEPFSIVKKTLEAMLAQKFPHDNWLADEDPSDEIREWCYANKVKLSCRKGITEYHRKTWPRRTKCKEGNLAYFYDHYGYDNYDFVAQFDADHVPEEGYLENMLRPFINDAIGYVSAPSICDTNGKESWAARGRLYAEAIMHGPLQAGYSDGFAPLCIGSHYSVRTKALKDIGGLGPELAEDHSTTLMMNGNGWRGIHSFDATARGEGPRTLADCITQEFQWSRSLMVLFLTELPKYWKKMTFRFKLQFLFSQLWFPLFSLFMLIGHLLPIIAVLMKKPWVMVSFTAFLQHSFPVLVSILAIIWLLKINDWLKPCYSPILSWEAMLFQIVRWPWSLYGSIMGVIVVFRKKNIIFKVTPKDVVANPPMNWSILYPYIITIIISALPAIILQDAEDASGYIFFLIFNVIIYTVLLFSIIIIHFNETKRATQIK